MAKISRSQPVNIGHSSARDHWNGLTCPAYSHFVDRQSIESAIECAKSIWELREFLWRDMHPNIDPREAPQTYKTFNDQLLAACPSLDLIRDIAESAKHGGQLSRNTVKVKGIKGAGGGGTLMESGPLGMYEHKPKCTFEIELNDGSVEKLPEVLERAMKYWRGKLS
jgi:hypothetical protein